jgi:hypothetical protein
MIEVIDGHRMERTVRCGNADVWEGWIVGQTA